MCSKVNWFVKYKLLFDLNYKFELIGAWLLALAKSTYYENTESYPLCLSKYCSLRSKRQLPLHWTKFIKSTISNFLQSYTCLPPPSPPVNILHNEYFQVYYFGTRRNWKNFLLKEKFGRQTKSVYILRAVQTDIH